MMLLIFMMLRLAFCAKKFSSSSVEKDVIDISDYDYPTSYDPLFEYVAILGTNDIHGTFYPKKVKMGDYDFTQGGLEYLGKYITILRKEFGKNFLWFDAGDIYEGGVETKQTNGDIMTYFYNIMKCDGASIGNHEWDFGFKFLKHHMERAKFPFLVSNLKNNTNNSTTFLPNQIETKIYKTKNNITIGVIGITTITTPLTTLIKFNDIDFMPYKDIIIEKAKQLRKTCNAVILLSHAGMKCLNKEEKEDKMKLRIRDKDTAQKECRKDDEVYQILQSLPQGTVDAVIAGHKHDSTHHWVKGTPIMSNRENGVNANVLYLPFDKRTGQLFKDGIVIEGPLPVCEKIFNNTRRCDLVKKINPGELKHFSFHGVTIEKEKKLKMLSTVYGKNYTEYFSKVLSRTKDTLITYKEKETALGNMFCDMLRNITGSDIAILNEGTFRTSWTTGNISYADAYNMMPFDNSVVSFTMTGREIRKMIKIVQEGNYAFYPTSGLRIVATAEPKKRVLSVSLFDGKNEKSIDDDREYVVSSTNFNIPNGGDDFSKVISWYKVRNYKPYFGILRDEAITYLKTVAEIDPKNFYQKKNPRLVIVKENEAMYYNEY